MVYQSAELSELKINHLPVEVQRDIFELWTGMKPGSWTPTSSLEHIVHDLDFAAEALFDMAPEGADPDFVKGIICTLFSPEVVLIEIAENMPPLVKAKLISMWINKDELTENLWHNKEMTRIYQVRYRIHREAGMNPKAAKQQSTCDVILAFL